METVRGVVLGTLLIIAATLLASGPLVPGLDLTESEVEASGGPTRINATVAQAPTDSFVFREGRYGTDVYFLEAPGATIDVTSISGSPTVVYDVEIPALNTTLSTVTFLDPGTERGPIRLEFEAPSVDSEDVTAESYPATVSIFTRVDSEKTVLYNASVEVSVEDR
jgi:hypothetical protein